MKKLALSTFILLFLLNFSIVKAESQFQIYKITINKEIGTTTWQYIKHGLKESLDKKSDAIIIELNTYGGSVDSADSIRTAILNHPVPVYAYINNNAASAGALIAIACDSIYMRKGANIGAATVVNGSGEILPDKYQSYMRSMIRSTAESHGKKLQITENGDTIEKWIRDPLIAEAMVDPKTSLSYIGDDSTRVVTFTAQEAVKYNFCEAIVESDKEIISTYLKQPEYKIAQYKPSEWIDIFGFLTNPGFQAILIMIMIGGIYFELQSPGIGFPTAASIIAAILYFAPLYMSGTAADWEIILFIAGLSALVLEIFVIPGFGIAGISGIVLILASLMLAGIDNSLFSFEGTDSGDIYTSLATVCFGIILGIALMIYISHKIGSKNSFMKYTALQLEQKTEDGYIGVPADLKEHIGKKAKTATVLRPAGKILIDDKMYDAVSIGIFIEQDKDVIVFKVENAQLYVKAI